MRKKRLLLLLLIVTTIVFGMMSAGAASLYGDLNADRSIDSTDLTIMKRVLLKKMTIEDVVAADLDGDGEVNSTDLTLLKRYLLKKITKFPVESADPTITPTFTQEVTPTPTQKPTPTAGINEYEQRTLDLINKERANAGLAPLDFDMELQNVARLKAKDMVENNYFSHQSPTYGSPFDMMKQFNISFRSAGENIAGYGTAEGAVKAWMESTGHRNNILNSSYNYTGIGVVDSPLYGKMLVQMFIGR